jgi:hypothetical protein
MKTSSMKRALLCLFTLTIFAPARAEDLRAFFNRYCMDCHDDGTKEGGHSFQSLRQFSDARPELWSTIHQQVELGQMPPKGASKPTAEERQLFLTQISGLLQSHGQHVHHKLDQPNYGNFLPHELLFNVQPHPAPATIIRAWRHRPSAYRLGNSGIQPLSLQPGQQISDYSTLYTIDESSTEIILRNAQQFIAGLTQVEVINGELRTIAGSQAAPWFFPILHPDRHPTAPEFAAAVNWMFTWSLDRAASEDELLRTRQLYDSVAASHGRIHAGRAALTVPLLMPEAVYRLELGSGPLDQYGRRRLSKTEILNALTHTLFDGRPPQPIQNVRAKPEQLLATQDEVAALVRELLNSPRPNPRVLVFFDEYFDYKKAVSVFKDVPQGIGGYDAGRLVRETARLINHIVTEDRDVFRRLLTTDLAFIEPRPPQSNQTPTHRIYNLPADFKVSKAPVRLAQDERAGILTQPAWLIAHSTNFDNDPVRRGKWILEHLLGGTVPDIPVTVNAVVSRDETRTLRDRFQSVRADGYCWKCHEQMNQLGMPFENYDQFGRFRLRELDGPVDSTGAVVTNGPIFDISDSGLAGDVLRPD